MSAKTVKLIEKVVSKYQNGEEDPIYICSSKKNASLNSLAARFDTVAKVKKLDFKAVIIYDFKESVEKLYIVKKDYKLDGVMDLNTGGDASFMNESVKEYDNDKSYYDGGFTNECVGDD